MTVVPPDNYLQMYRKRTGLTHEESAFLCGAMCGTSVSRHEKGDRLPMLKTALMYEFILQASLCEFYAGVFHDVRADLLRDRDDATHRTIIGGCSPSSCARLVGHAVLRPANDR